MHCLEAKIRCIQTSRQIACVFFAHLYKLRLVLTCLLQIAGTSLELPTTTMPGEYVNVPEQPAHVPEQPAPEPTTEDVSESDREPEEVSPPPFCPADPFYNFLTIRPRLVPEELKIPPYEQLPPAPPYLPPFENWPEDEWEYWFQWCYPAVTLLHQLRAIGRMTPFVEAYLRHRGNDGIVDVHEFRGILEQVKKCKYHNL